MINELISYIRRIVECEEGGYRWMPYTLTFEQVFNLKKRKIYQKLYRRSNEKRNHIF